MGRWYQGISPYARESFSPITDCSIQTEFAYKLKPKLPQQFKLADANGVPFAVILGDDEQAQGKVKIKQLGVADNHPEKEGVLVDVKNLVEEVRIRLERKAAEDGAAGQSTLVEATSGLSLDELTK